MSNEILPINLASLLPVLDRKLLTLLHSLSDDEWQAQTIAKLWKVKDVAAHLLDTNIRSLSIIRDHYWGEKASPGSFEELVAFLNQLNADWVKAMKRVSPRMLILLHEITGPLYCDYFQSIDPGAKSVLAVDWAGENESRNWMHIAREYTEKFLHQQQIREAVNKPGIMTTELFYPFMNTFMYALPHTYRHTGAATGTAIELIVETEIGGSWTVIRSEQGWQLTNRFEGVPNSRVFIQPDEAWKLFSKSIRPGEVGGKVRIEGNAALGEVALNMISVMA